MSREPWDNGYSDEPFGEDPEGPQECDLAGSGDDSEYDVVACPHCGREISELTGNPISTLMSRFRQGLERIRERMGQPCQTRKN